jgi:N-acetylglucosamine kinase-like BadF-type ATPase
VGAELLLGVDGGNTKTHALLTDADGHVLGHGHSGTGDIHNSEPEPALVEIVRACEEALAVAGASTSDLDATAFSLAGADWPEDFVLLRDELTKRLDLLREPVIVNDGIGPLRCGTEDGVGVAAVIGTYCAVGARNDAGEVFHLGFWPDGAGGRHIGRSGLDAVYRAALGIAPATALTERAFARYGVRDAFALLHEFTRRGGLGDSEHDRLAPVLLDVADAGNAVAQAIVADAGRVLGRQARASAAQVGLPLEGARVVLTGGVFEHPTDRLAAATMAELPGAVPVRHGPPPIAGALLLAYDRLGVAVDASTVAAGLPATDGRSARWAASPSMA